MLSLAPVSFFYFQVQLVLALYMPRCLVHISKNVLASSNPSLCSSVSDMRTHHTVMKSHMQFYSKLSFLE